MQIASSPGTSDRLTKLIQGLEDSEQKRALAWNIRVYEFFVTLPDNAPQEYVDLLKDLMDKAWNGEVVENGRVKS
jgi:hypothetical protein